MTGKTELTTNGASTVFLSDVLSNADKFLDRLREAKASASNVAWYPYDSIANIHFLRTITSDLAIEANKVLDIGAADGDLSFLFASNGARVDVVENERTNFNRGEGLHALNRIFGEQVSITFTDIDFGFTLPRQYDFALALGLAYHLRNVPLLYITLAQHCRFMVSNTRVIDVTPTGIPIGQESIGYFLECRQLNNDPTNFWLFSPETYRRVLKRCGWRVLRETFVGAEQGSLDQDKRMWVLCERVPNYADLRLHHDF